MLYGVSMCYNFRFCTIARMSERIDFISDNLIRSLMPACVSKINGSLSETKHHPPHCSRSQNPIITQGMDSLPMFLRVQSSTCSRPDLHGSPGGILDKFYVFNTLSLVSHQNVIVTHREMDALIAQCV